MEGIHPGSVSSVCRADDRCDTQLHQSDDLWFFYRDRRGVHKEQFTQHYECFCNVDSILHRRVC